MKNSCLVSFELRVSSRIIEFPPAKLPTYFPPHNEKSENIVYFFMVKYLHSLRAFSSFCWNWNKILCFIGSWVIWINKKKEAKKCKAMMTRVANVNQKIWKQETTTTWDHKEIDDRGVKKRNVTQSCREANVVKKFKFSSAISRDYTKMRIIIFATCVEYSDDGGCVLS